MSDFENELRNALRPVDPGAGFTAGVMERLARERDGGAAGGPDPDEPVETLRRRAPQWLPFALAASLVFAAVGASYWQQRNERAEGLQAREQLLEALRVTSDKLDIAYDEVNSGSGGENAGA